MFKHLIALIQDEVFDVLQVELLALDEGQDTSGGSNDDVRTIGLQDLLVLGDGQAAKKDANLKKFSNLFNAKQSQNK